jgi:hypothetical protein
MPTPENSNAITALITVDTDAVRARYPNPSHTPERPTRVDHHLAYMVAAGTTIDAGQGTGDLSINALVGDTIRAFAISGSDDFEDAVLLYGMTRFNGDQMLGKFAYRNFTVSTVAPNSDTNPLPARTTEEQCWFFRARVIGQGTERFLVKFGLYVRDESTGQPVLAGYYAWDPTITVRE